MDKVRTADGYIVSQEEFEAVLRTTDGQAIQDDAQEFFMDVVFRDGGERRIVWNFDGYRAMNEYDQDLYPWHDLSYVTIGEAR